MGTMRRHFRIIAFNRNSLSTHIAFSVQPGEDSKGYCRRLSPQRKAAKNVTISHGNAVNVHIFLYGVVQWMKVQNHPSHDRISPNLHHRDCTRSY